MREAHVHLYALGESLTLPNAAGCGSVGELLELVATHARGAGARERHTPVKDTPRFVRVLGARPEAWPERRWPTLSELDRASGVDGAPVVVMSFDHHTAVANSTALAAAGLEPGQVVPPKGLVCTDKHGRATGELHEHAAYAVWGAAPEPTPGERKRNVVAGLRLLRDLGFDEAHEMHAQEWLGPLLGGLDREGVLEVSCRLYAPAHRLVEDAAGKRVWESARVKLAGGKVFADGTLNSRTALMLHGYAEPSAEGGPLGRAMVTGVELDARLREAESLGLHLAVHAIGDGAVRMVLDAVERVRNEVRGPGAVGAALKRVDAGHRVEHAELVDEADAPRFARLGVVCSVQPCHLLTDIEVLTRQMPGRLSRVLPLRELIDAGCEPGRGLVFGSDAPIVRPNPQDSIIAAVQRRRPIAGGRGCAAMSDAIAPEQAIDEDTAWACIGRRDQGIEGLRDQGRNG